MIREGVLMFADVKTDGISDVTIWYVMVGVFILASLTQALRANDQEPPLARAKIIVRALLGGVAGVALAFLVVARWDVEWEYLLGGAIVVGYTGSDVLNILSNIGRAYLEGVARAPGSKK